MSGLPIKPLNSDVKHFAKWIGFALIFSTQLTCFFEPLYYPGMKLHASFLLHFLLIWRPVNKKRCTPSLERATTLLLYYLITNVKWFSHFLSFSNVPPFCEMKLWCVWWLSLVLQQMASIRCSIASWLPNVWIAVEGNPDRLWHRRGAATRWQKTNDPHGSKLSPSSD